MQKRLLLALLAFPCLLWYCQSSQPLPSGDVRFDPDEAPYPKLSDYAFFREISPETFLPSEGVLLYEPITPLFTDYAHKARYVWMPDSVQASVAEDGRLQFPDNSVLIKHFYYPADFSQPGQGRDLVETRLLMKRRGEWDAYTYVWNESDTEAELNLVGDFKTVHWKDETGQARTVEYAVPNKNQCKSCHNQQKKLLPIGPKVRHLNAELQYPDGRAENQLRRWQAEGKLVAGDWAEQYAALADWEEPGSGSLEARALAYLEVNCGHCHHPKGPAHTTGLYLGRDFADRPAQLGICKSPVAAGKGSGGRSFGIRPGHPEQSILLYRMQAEDPGVMMPEIGRAVPHEEGIALIREWIEAMPGDCPGEGT